MPYQTHSMGPNFLPEHLKLDSEGLYRMNGPPLLTSLPWYGVPHTTLLSRSGPSPSRGLSSSHLTAPVAWITLRIHRATKLVPLNHLWVMDPLGILRQKWALSPIHTHTLCISFVPSMEERHAASSDLYLFLALRDCKRHTQDIAQCF